jgi:hypothetical protein
MPKSILPKSTMPKSNFAAAVMVFGLLFSAAPSLAQEPTAGAAPPQDASQPPSRFSFNRVESGFVRLDTTTGTVTYCSVHSSVGWACEAVPEDRAALEKEIARLQDQVGSLKDQVGSLKQELTALREPPPPRPPADLSPSGKDDAAKLREDMARARAALENAWHRLVDMIVNFQKDIMPKG